MRIARRAGATFCVVFAFGIFASSVGIIKVLRQFEFDTNSQEDLLSQALLRMAVAFAALLVAVVLWPPRRNKAA